MKRRLDALLSLNEQMHFCIKVSFFDLVLELRAKSFGPFDALRVKKGCKEQNASQTIGNRYLFNVLRFSVVPDPFRALSTNCALYYCLCEMTPVPFSVF